MRATAIHPFSQEEVMAYLDGELTPARMLAAARHLEECGECQRLVEDLKQVSETLVQWEVETPAAASAPRRVFSWKRLRPSWLQPRMLALSASVLVVLIAAMFSFRAEVSAPSRGPKVAMSAQRPESFMALQRETPGVAGGPITQAVVPEPQPAAENGALIVRTAELTIVSNRFDQARADLERTAAEAHGYVAQLELTTSADNGRALDATLRVPAAELQNVIDRLRVLGRVEAESERGEDVTQRSVDLNARLSNLETTETRLLQILRDRAGKLADVLQVEEAVDRTRGEIEVARAEQQTLSKQIALASLRLQVSEQYHASAAPTGSPIGTRLRNAAVEGYRNLVEMVTGFTAFLLAAGPSLLAIAIVCFFPARWLWKRSRSTEAVQR